jgi:hypothetical protein
MKLGPAFFVAGLLALSISHSGLAQQGPAVSTEQLTQWVIEDIARQRAKVREQDAEQARRNLPDLSQFGSPVATPPAHRNRARSSNEIHCTTINMGDGDSATDCF